MLHSEIIINENYPGLNPVQFGYQDCTPSHAFGPAVRSHWLLHYVVSGCGIFRREGAEYQINPGEIFVIPPFLETYYEADANHPWRYIWVGFTGNVALPVAFDQPVICCTGIGKVFEDMRRCQNMQNGKSAFLASRIWEMISIILETGKKENDYIEKALHCINAEYMTDITVAQLAERLNLDRCYFSTLFSKQVGVSPSQYLMNLRLDRARELMLRHDQSPSVAAASVGYTDIYNFSKMFKKKYGTSPRQYIREHQQNG